jgi:hypothetical protein
MDMNTTWLGLLKLGSDIPCRKVNSSHTIMIMLLYKYTVFLYASSILIH